MNTVAPSQIAVGRFAPFYTTPCSDLAAGITSVASRHVYLLERALTVGFTTINDAVSLLEHGFRHVDHYDLSPGCNHQAEELHSTDSRFWHHKTNLFLMNFMPNRYDAVISNHGVAYHPPEGFKDMFRELKASVRVSGALAVTLFGVRDEWLPNHGQFAMFERMEAIRLFRGFDIRHFHEHEFDGRFIDGTPKHWHYFTVVATQDDCSM